MSVCVHTGDGGPTYREQERQRHLTSSSAASHLMTPDASSNHFTLTESLKVSGPVHPSLALEETTIDDGSNFRQGVASVEEDHGAGRDARDWQDGNKQGVRSHVTGSVVPETGCTASTVLAQEPHPSRELRRRERTV